MEAWLRMLDHVQESLTRALQDLDAHELWLAETESDAVATGTPPDAERRCLDMIDDRLRGLAGHEQASGRLAADVEALLADDERAVGEWAEQVAAARRRLAGLAAAGVS
jgi:hypothetical protein